MNFSEDIVPSTLTEAVELLKSDMAKEEIDAVKTIGDTMAFGHFTLGMAVRNNWSLWDKETRLVKWFKSNYGVEHADDISGIILDCVLRDIQGKPRRDKELAKQYINHWVDMQELKNSPGKVLKLHLDDKGNIIKREIGDSI